jgi:hypothetical protein
VYSTTNGLSQRGSLSLEPFQRSSIVSQQWGELLKDLSVIRINPSLFRSFQQVYVDQVFVYRALLYVSIKGV